MEAYLGNYDKIMFNKYLDSCKVYFEFGSGGSTYQANLRSNITKIYSVESDKNWYDEVSRRINTDKLVYFYNEMKTIPNTWGHPGPGSTKEQHIKYSNYLCELTSDEQQSIDIVMIDGRFRVACCLKCHDIIRDDCLILFDDFLNRKHYHIVLNYFDIKEKTQDERMVVLTKKQGVYVPRELINKYEAVKD